jgi:hypothetical protein
VCGAYTRVDLSAHAILGVIYRGSRRWLESCSYLPFSGTLIWPMVPPSTLCAIGSKHMVPIR